MSNTPPNDPWWQSSQGEQPPPPPPPPPGGGYPPPPPQQPGGYPPQQPGGYPPQQPGGYPPPGGGYQQPGSWGSGGYPPSGGGYPPPPPVDPRYQYGQRTTGYVLAGWWYRVGATIIDGLVLVIPEGILRAVGGAYVGPLLSLILGATYITLMLSRKGQTVGNMAVGTRVVDSQTGGPLSTGKALGRWAAEFVLWLLLIIPGILDILWPLWDKQNQSLHDKMAGTVVLKDS